MKGLMSFRKLGIAAGYGVPALILLSLAFWAGGQADPMAGMLGFVPFFMGAAFLVIYGHKKIMKQDEFKEGDPS